MKIKITPNEKGNPLGKLADAEIHFEQMTPEALDAVHHFAAISAGTDNPGLAQALRVLQGIGALGDLKLIGFGIWESRGIDKRRNVTFPARTYQVNGERRSFALLRPIVDTTAQNRIRDLILEAYQEWEENEARLDLRTQPSQDPPLARLESIAEGMSAICPPGWKIEHPGTGITVSKGKEETTTPTPKPAPSFEF